MLGVNECVGGCMVGCMRVPYRCVRLQVQDWMLKDKKNSGLLCDSHAAAGVMTVSVSPFVFLQAKAEISGVTGRMTYRGRVMNRTARIAERSAAGQV